jgi:hypothetical protein
MGWGGVGHSDISDMNCHPFNSPTRVCLEGFLLNVILVSLSGAGAGWPGFLRGVPPALGAKQSSAKQS